MLSDVMYSRLKAPGWRLQQVQREGGEEGGGGEPGGGLGGWEGWAVV